MKFSGNSKCKQNNVQLQTKEYQNVNKVGSNIIKTASNYKQNKVQLATNQNHIKHQISNLQYKTQGSDHDTLLITQEF